MNKTKQSTTKYTKDSTKEELEDLELFIEKKKIQNQAFKKIIENLDEMNNKSNENQ